MLRPRNVYIVLLIYSFLLMLFSTGFSPLFSFVPTTDAHVFIVMGRGLIEGYVPYRDLMDHKGPFLFLLFGISALIDKTGFFGVYVLLASLVSLSTIFTYRIAKLFIKREDICFFVAIVSPLTAIDNLVFDFYAGQGTADEIIRYLLVVPLYYFALYYSEKNKNMNHLFMFQGILFAMVFLIKFSLIMFWAGFLFVIFCELIQSKQFSKLITYIAYFTIGIFAVFLPYLIYALFTESLWHFFEYYFRFNISYSGVGNGGMIDLFARSVSAILLAIRWFAERWLFSILLIAGFVFSFLKLKAGFVFGYTLSFLALAFSIFSSHRWGNQHLPLTIYFPLALVLFGVIIEKHIPMNSKPKKSKVLLALIMIFCSTIAMNGRFRDKAFLWQDMAVEERMAKVIWEHSSNDNPTLLVALLNVAGLYTASNILPSDHYFYIPAYSSSFPQILEAHIDSVREGRNEFVIVNVASAEAEPDNRLNIHEHYTLIHTIERSHNAYFQLWQRQLGR